MKYQRLISAENKKKYRQFVTFLISPDNGQGQ